jgi:phage baseplate assembly protein W
MYETFHFAHPDERPFHSGLTTTPRGSLRIVAGGDAIRQSILMLLSTVPGERVMRPDYGCNLRQLVFAPNDDTTAGLAAHYVRQALQNWEPRIRLLRVDAEPDPLRDDALVIRVDYRVRTTELAEQLAYLFQLGVADR